MRTQKCDIHSSAFDVYDNIWGEIIMDRDAKSIGANIRKYRTERNMSQYQLAEILGLTPNYVSMIERGEKCPSLPILVKTANTLNVSADMLLCGVLDNTYQIKGSQLLERINALPQTEQDRILAVIEALLHFAEK